MSHSLPIDERGVLVSCTSCGTTNRITFTRLGTAGRCGSCKTSLPAVDAPLEIHSTAGFQALVTSSPLPVIVDFWAPWCGPCKMMAPEFAKAASLAAGRAVFAKVNTDEQQELAMQYRIQGIPAFARVESGRLTGQTGGFQPAAQLLGWALG